MAPDPKQRRAARHAQPQPDPATATTTSAAAASEATPGPAAKTRTPITIERITDAALQVVATEGYDALTIRRVTNVLGTGPSSLYAHIVNKADIDDLIIGRLCAQIVLPKPDPARWQEQLRDVYAQMRDLYLKYPGISKAALAMVATNLETLRVSEGIFAILLAGGIEPQTAAWAMDGMTLYVAGYALEVSLVQQRQKDQDATWVLSQDEMVSRLTALPEDTFPQTRRYATELTSGQGHERFDFTLTQLIDSLTHGGR